MMVDLEVGDLFLDSGKTALKLGVLFHKAVQFGLLHRERLHGIQDVHVTLQTADDAPQRFLYAELGGIRCVVPRKVFF